MFSEKPLIDPPVRGPYCECEIKLKPDATPVKQREFQISGERREAMIKMVEKLLEENKIEVGQSAWSSPAFPVAKKTPGKYRLVVDYRRLNSATIPDSNPIPRIEDILQRQDQYRIWTVLDMKDGFHQVPIKPSDRHYTCMSTPLGG